MKTRKELWRERRNMRLVDRLEQQKAARSANQSRFLGKEIDSIRDLVGPRKPFCYLNYAGFKRSGYEEDNYFYAIRLYGRNVADMLYPGTEYVQSKRPFASYTKAVAHLTAVKLAACEEEGEYKGLKPCQIVEGYYTRSGKEVVEKTWSVTDERISVGRDNTSGGQSSEQRAADFCVSQNLADTQDSYVENVARRRVETKRRLTEKRDALRRSRSATGSSSTTTVDPKWHVTDSLSSIYGRTVTGCV